MWAAARAPIVSAGTSSISASLSSISSSLSSVAPLILPHLFPLSLFCLTRARRCGLQRRRRVRWPHVAQVGCQSGCDDLMRHGRGRGGLPRPTAAPVGCRSGQSILPRPPAGCRSGRGGLRRRRQGADAGPAVQCEVQLWHTVARGAATGHFFIQSLEVDDPPL